MYDTVNIRTMPNAFTVADTAACAGTIIVPLVQGDTSFSYTWTPSAQLTFPSPAYPGSQQHPSFLADTTTTFTITAQYAGCAGITRQLTVTVEPIPVITLPADTMYKGATSPLSISTNVSPLWFGNYSYQWVANGNIDSPANAVITFSGATDTTLIVTVTTPHGCVGRDSVVVINTYMSVANVVTIPNAFAPNGVNSRFNILRIAPGYSLSAFRIYNRWGKRVFDTNNASIGWDGTVSGTNAPMGVYVYTIETVSTKGERVIQKGSVALIR
jgi:gliding motility-associated-like protein